MTWRRFFRRTSWDRDRAEELRSYLAIETDENIARGMPADEARRAAHLKLGNTVRIREDRPGWYLWRDGVVPGGPGHPGETIEQVGARVDRAIARVRPVLADGGDVAVVAHGHLLRVLTARWLGLPPQDGRLFRLDTGTVSALGFEHGEPVILRWNAPVRAL